MIDFSHDINNYGFPLIATAIHDGHRVRDEVSQHLSINEEDRLREEDPFTGFFTDISENRLVINSSRFEVDVNRPRENAIYKTPGQAWGLKVWKDNVPKNIWDDLLADYDGFYRFLRDKIERIIQKSGYVVVYDIHSYNFRRTKSILGDKPAKNPDINVGTGTLDKTVWAPVVETFMQKLHDFDFLGRHLRIAENVRFKGGFLSEWIHTNFPGKSCVLAIELKKFFMDEWTGVVDIRQMNILKKALKGTVPGVMKTAGKIYVNSVNAS